MIGRELPLSRTAPVHPSKEAIKMAKDVICRMEVKPETAPAQTEYKGKTYYFCAPGCKTAFEKNPEKYLQAARGGGEHHVHNG
jgi:Cu+-exporting ATPase